jgi:hypothetical protein
LVYTFSKVAPVPYIPPTFNIDVGVWKKGVDNTPSIHVLDCKGQLRAPSTGHLHDVAYNIGKCCSLLVPKKTAIMDRQGPGSATHFVEAPKGTGRWYEVIMVDDIGKGFPNEHRYAVLVKYGVWPDPIP